MYEITLFYIYISIQHIPYLNKVMSKVYKKLIQLCFLSGTLVLLLTVPDLTLNYAKKGLSIWYQNMVPALLPMMILTSCMIKLNVTGMFASIIYPITKKLYHLSKNGTYALLVGFLCGFPMGAKVICELYNQKKLSKNEANALLPICNNIGPVFMLTYGLKAFITEQIYLVLLLFYALPLIYAFYIFRTYDFQNTMEHSPKKLPFSVALDESISESAAGILSLGGYLMFFSILTLIPKEIIPLTSEAVSFLTCFLEITNGLSHVPVLPSYVLLALLQFGGICCIFQTIKYISQTDLSFKNYMVHKTILTILTLAFFFAADVFSSVF